MSDDLHVDAERLREASRFIADQARVMRTRLKELDDMIGNRLLAEGWDGTAATGYGGSWTDWKKGADMVVDALGESSIGLADAATGYEAQDAAHSRSIQRVTNSLDLPGL